MEPTEVGSGARRIPVRALDARAQWVVCAVSITSMNQACIARASALCEATGASMALVLCAIERRNELDVDAAVALARLHDPKRVFVVFGAADEAIEAVCRAVSSSIVLVADGLLDGERARRLCAALALPVLVSRVPRSAVLVAATDLSRVSAPVLRWSRALNAVLRYTLVIAHNVERPLPLGSFEWSHIDVSEVEARQRHTLDAMVARDELAARVSVSANFDTPDALVALTDSVEADVIAVGAKRSLLQWWPSRSVAARLVDECKCSVLLVPFEHEPHGEPA
jgi:nucleotide-binding universal stress UspA family protein